MARYKITLAYDGTAFRGSQRQARSRTVQGELERALRRLGWSGLSATLAGRTDTGVHAAGQVAAFDLDWAHGAEALGEALNAGLPADMAVKQVEPAEPKFQPRFDATSRLYRYCLFCAAVRDPLRERQAWRIWPEVDGELLQRTARLFPGRHDFAAFGSATRPAGSTLRTVSLAQWTGGSGEWQFEVRAEAFLYRMVRRLVFVQSAVARGRCPIEAVARALENPSERGRGIPAGLAPAHGLTLIEVSYAQSVTAAR